MKSFLLSGLLLTSLVGAPAEVQPMRFERFGLYVLVDDVGGAELFYRRLFGAEPQVRTAALTGFDVAGGLFALVSRQGYGQGARPGGAVRPYIRVADIAAAFEHVRRVAPQALETQAVVEEGPFRFFRLRDPEGNVLEYFEVRR